MKTTRGFAALVALGLALGASTATPARADGAGFLARAAKAGLRTLGQAGKKTLVTTGKAAVFAARAGSKAVAGHGKDAARLLPPSRLTAPITQRLAAPVARSASAAGASHAAAAIGQGAKAAGKSSLLGKADDVLSLLWRHKGAVALTAGVATVAAQPDLFVGAAKEVATSTTQQVMEPVADSARRVAEETARVAAWPLALLAVCVAAVLAFTLLRGVFALWRLARKPPPAS